MPTNTQREKIAIIGGGIGGMTTAFELMQSGKPYDITVYQLGWRLGGKGASGRNAKYYHRIEEHGLHLWGGLYDNAFRIMQEAYKLLGRAPDAPLATWQDAFKPLTFAVAQEHWEGQWLNWPFELPTNDKVPGEGDAHLKHSIWFYIEQALEIALAEIRKLRLEHVLEGISFSVETGVEDLEVGVEHLVERLAPAEVSFAAEGEAGVYPGARMLLALNNLLQWEDKGANALANFLGEKVMGLFAKVPTEKGLLKHIFLWLLGEFMKCLWRDVKNHLDDTHTRRIWLILNFTYGNIRGLLEGDLLERGFDVVDDLNYRDWLNPYLIPDGGLTLNSPFVWSLYDGNFAFTNGDPEQPHLSAAVALYTAMRMTFGWRGSLLWKMQAGMGDTVFTPLYQVLQRAGVKFKFFHRAKQLHLSADKKSVAAITMGIQARLKSPYDQEGYQPLVQVKGLDCWPSTPLYEQLEGGDRGIDYEAWCSPELEEMRLEAGRDFDKIVLATSIGPLPYIACELIQANPRWKAMVDHIKTIRTQAFQLWLKPTAFELGWKLMRQPMLDTYRVNPVDTWADMSHLLEREGWPALGDRCPLNIAYFCGVMPDPKPLTPTGCGPTATCEEMSQEVGNESARANSVHYLNKFVGHLWPNAVDEQGFKWALLVDNRPAAATGAARIEAQFARANVQPSERYVLAVEGSTKYRLWPGATGFANLTVSGDWVWNGFNLGNVESAVMGGMLAANAISGYPALDKIVGLTFGHPNLKLPQGP